MNIIVKNKNDKNDKNDKLNANTPKDIQLFKSLLEEEGIEQYEKNSLLVLNDFINSYASDIIKDTLNYLKFSSRQKPTMDDFKFAIKLRNENLLNKKLDNSALTDFSNALKYKNKEFPKISNEKVTLNLPSLDNSVLKNNFHVYSDEVRNELKNSNKDIYNWIFRQKLENHEHKKQKGLSLTSRKGDKVKVIQNENGDADSINSNKENKKNEEKNINNKNNSLDLKESYYKVNIDDEENYD